jgi:hypothetical protein
VSVSRPFGEPISPAQALAKAASALVPIYRVPPAPGLARVQLQSEDPRLPDIELSMVRDRRMFSRTWPLVIEAGAEGSGPDQAIQLRLHRPRLKGSLSLRPEAGSSADAPSWGSRFAEAGLLDGATTMTGVQDLLLAWTPGDRRWKLRLQTLAGALVGTAPGSSIAVGLEPEDIEGLLQVLRAFRAAAATRG